MNWSSPAARAAAGGLFAGWAIALAAPRDFPVGTMVDDAQYAVLAKSLRTDGSYRTLNLPDRPPETKFPPGFPALLALLWSPGRSDTANLERARYVNLALLGPLGGVLAASGVVALGLTPALSATATAASLLTARTAALWTMPMSEPLCLLLVAGALLAAAAGYLRGAVALVAAAGLVRTLALAFLPALLVLVARRAGRRACIQAAAIAALLLAPWFAWGFLHGAAVPREVLGVHGSYASWYVESLRADPWTVVIVVPLTNLLLAARGLGEALLGWDLAHNAVLAATGAVVAGLVSGLRGAPLLRAGLGMYALVVLLWPFPQADRFVGGVWPLVMLAAVAALPWRAVRIAMAGGSLALALVGFARGESVRGHRVAGAAARSLIATVNPVIGGARALAVSNPPLYYLSTGVPAVPSQRMRSYRWYRHGYWAAAWGLGDDLWALIARYHPDYLIIEQRGAEGRFAAGSLLRQCPGVLRELWRSPRDEALFRINRDAACAPARTQR